MSFEIQTTSYFDRIIGDGEGDHFLRPHIFRGEMLREYAMLPSKFGKGESACNTCPEWDCWLIKAIPTARHSIPKWASCT